MALPKFNDTFLRAIGAFRARFRTEGPFWAVETFWADVSVLFKPIFGHHRRCVAETYVARCALQAII